MCAYCVAMTDSDHPATTPIGALHEIVIDCADVAALSQFWQAVLGGERRVRSDGWGDAHITDRSNGRLPARA